jgi:hypothetical protein
MNMAEVVLLDWRGSTVQCQLRDIGTCMFVWLVVDGWCWFVLRKNITGWLLLREKNCSLVADNS